MRITVSQSGMTVISAAEADTEAYGLRVFSPPQCPSSFTKEWNRACTKSRHRTL